MEGEVFAPAAKGLGVSVVLIENEFDCDLSSVNTFAKNGVVFPWLKVAAASKVEGTL